MPKPVRRCDWDVVVSFTPSFYDDCSTLVEVSARRQIMERSWVVVSLLYGLLRVSLVWQFLSKYGVNTAVYLCIELCSSAMYGISSARVVGSFVDSEWRLLKRWAPIALLAYAAPDAYVFASAGRLPGSLLRVLVSIVFVTATFTSIGMWLQIRDTRRERLQVN